MGQKPSGRAPARCSFCGKPQDQVKRLVAGPGVYICNQCIDLCNEVMREEPPSLPGAGSVKTRAQMTYRGGRGRTWLERLFLRAQPAG